MRNPSVPLTVEELKAIAGIRLSKQVNKRVVLIVIPALLLAIAGVAFHRGSSFDIGLLLVVLAMVGCAGGLVVVGQWTKRETIKFARTHAGSFWTLGKEEKEPDFKWKKV
jgi:predicted MFS family arabinose efflux permease